MRNSYYYVCGDDQCTTLTTLGVQCHYMHGLPLILRCHKMALMFGAEETPS